jgi:uncharacterized membrane protein YfcA
MLDNIPVSIIVGCVLGFLTGLGTGGGSLLMLWLTFVLGYGAPEARLINLMFFFPGALTATILRCHREPLPFRKLLTPTLAGCAAAAAFSLLGQKINTESLEKLFGVLLIILGIKELFYRPRKPR